VTAARRRRGRAGRGGAAGFALALLLGGACGGTEDPAAAAAVLEGADPIAREVSELQRSLLRGGGAIRSSTPVTRSRHGVKASWEIELSGTWPEYAAWGKTRIPPPFELRQEAPDRLVFARSGHADSYVVTISRLGAGAARVEYAGAPW